MRSVKAKICWDDQNYLGFRLKKLDGKAYTYEFNIPTSNLLDQFLK